MTVRDKLEEMLVHQGLWPHEATAVFDLMLERHGKEAGLGEVKYNDPVEAYPVQVYACVLMTLRQIAVEWIDEHKPKHFARAILERGKRWNTRWNTRFR